MNDNLKNPIPLHPPPMISNHISSSGPEGRRCVPLHVHLIIIHTSHHIIQYLIQYMPQACCVIALMGMPICSSLAYPMIHWLKQCVKFPLMSRNFWVGCNVMVAKLMMMGTCMYEHDMALLMDERQLRQHQSWMPPRLGGQAAHPAWKKARCYLLTYYAYIYSPTHPCLYA